MWWLAAYLLVGAVVSGVFLEIDRRMGVGDGDGWLLFNTLVAWPLVIALALGMAVANWVYERRG